jgi:ubiquinone/menaquinone biosynthesis C-methylase UbiE
MDHLDRVRGEFSRQADAFSVSPALNDQALTLRFVDALGREPVGRLLDIACGPGILVAALAPHAAEVVGLDLTPAMLAKARERCRAQGIANVSLVEGDATRMSFPDGHFDVVVTRLAIHHFPDPSAVLKEARRVLRRDGRLVLADVVSSETADEADLQNAIETLRDPSHARMLPASELRAVVAAAGFAVLAETSWDKPREFDEWLGIVDYPSRAKPLRTVVRRLAADGNSAGMGLVLDAEGALRFFHRWILLVAA